MPRTNQRYATYAEFEAIRLHMNMDVKEFCAFLGTTPDHHWKAFQRGYVSRNLFQAAERLRRFNKPKEGPPPPPLKRHKGPSTAQADLDLLASVDVDLEGDFTC